MLDGTFIVITGLFFVLAAGYARGCERLRERP